MMDEEKVMRELSRLANEIHRLKQSHLEIQKEIIRYRLQERIEEWQKRSVHGMALLPETGVEKMQLH